MVSVIIPSFNRENLIIETLESVRRQTDQSFECIIIDDGSSDNTREVVQQFIHRDARFKLFSRDREPKGASTCRNIGWRLAKGDLIIFLDSDDLLREYSIEFRKAFLEGNDSLDYAVFPCDFFNKKIGDIKRGFSLVGKDSDLSRFLRHDFPWHTSSPIWKKTTLERLDGFEEKDQEGGGQDWELHIRAIASGLKYRKVEGEADCFFRSHDSKSRISRVNSVEKLKSRASLYRKTFDYVSRLGLMSPTRASISIGAYFHVIVIPLLSLGESEEAQNQVVLLSRAMPISTGMSNRLFFYIRSFGKAPPLQNGLALRSIRRLFFFKDFYHYYFDGSED